MKLELGTYVDCSKLTDEQRQRLLDKFVELVRGDCYHVDEDTSDFSHIEHFLVYSMNYEDERVIWFWDDHLRANIEKTYYDFFPEELETPDTTSETPVKRVKTIDLERNSKTFEIKLAEFEVDLVNLGEGYTLTELNELLDRKLLTKGNAYCNDQFEKDGDPKFTIYQDGKCEVYQSYKVESEEDYQQRVQREKDLNDMYNANVQNLTKKILHLQQDLDDVSAILNGQTTLGASQVMDIKKIIGGK